MKAALRAPRPSRFDSAHRDEPLRAFVSAPPDMVLFGAVATLVAIGLVMIFSASSTTGYADYHDTAYFLKHQVVFLAAGALLAYIAYRVEYRKLKALAPYILVLSVFSLIAVLVPHVGVMVNGARRWIGAGAFSLQPSEFAKISLVLYLAAVLSSRGERITSLAKGLFPLCVPVVIMAMLILREPDLGTASLLVMTAFALFFAAGARLEHLTLILLATVPPVVATILASPYKRARIFAFVNPWKDAQNTGFHIVQSLLALGSGGVLGVGLGQSRAKFFYLPEQYTDFIFSVLGEELGLVGALAVVVLFVLFAYRSVRIAIAAPDRFGFFLVVGCAALIVIQAFINIGVVTSSWPVTGVLLPFISFGGSSLIVNLIAVALIMNVGRYRRVNLK
ncbi:MAG: putative lipid II flippase FtsW [Vulcanimicrobiaceae bacterium]